MTAKKPTCGTGLKSSILYHMTASQASFFTSLIDKFHNCNKNGYFPAMHTKLDLKIIIILKNKNFAIMATVRVPTLSIKGLSTTRNGKASTSK